MLNAVPYHGLRGSEERGGWVAVGVKKNQYILGKKTNKNDLQNVQILNLPALAKAMPKHPYTKYTKSTPKCRKQKTYKHTRKKQHIHKRPPQIAP